jgi:hypothetical protein
MPSKLVLFTALLLGAAAPALTATANWDGLTEVNSRRMGTTFLLAGADFRPYKKVLLEEPQVAFRNNWLRDVHRGSAGRRVSQGDADRILASVSTNLTDVFAREFTRAGFEVVTKPGPDVLRLNTDIINLFVNAPDTGSSARTQSFTTNAGEATIVLEARDSQTNALLARAVERRQTQTNAGMGTRATSVSNTADFRRLAQGWARTTATKLQNLQAISPVPDPLTPGQRVN